MKYKYFVVLTVFFLALSICPSGFAAESPVPSKKTSPLLDAVVLYVPNRILDILDMFSLNIGAGLGARAELHATQALKVGGGIDYCMFKAMKDTNRQYGACMQNGVDFALGPVRMEDMLQKNPWGFVKEYYRNTEGVPSSDEEIYQPNTGAIDYWSFGGSLGVGIIEADVNIHPVDWIDAVFGILLIDIKGDDLTFENFR